MDNGQLWGGFAQSVDFLRRDNPCGCPFSIIEMLGYFNGRPQAHICARVIPYDVGFDFIVGTIHELSVFGLSYVQVFDGTGDPSPTV